MYKTLSVIIPHYGDPEPTLALIKQLGQQRGSVPEIVVSDDCSPEPFPSGIDGVHVVRRSKNGGFGSAVNSGVEAATGDLILIINSDVTMDDDFLESLLAGARPFLPAVVAPRVDEAWGERVMGRYWPTARGMALEALIPAYRFSGSAWYESLLGNDERTLGGSEPIVVDWAVGVCLLIPKEDFRAVGGFDERFFMNCEEIDLQRRLRNERGLDVVVLPSPRLSHVGGGSSASERRAGWLTDARMRYYAKWHWGPALYGALTGTALINLAWQSGRRALGRDLHPLARFRAETHLINHAWKARR